MVALEKKTMGLQFDIRLISFVYLYIDLFGKLRNLLDMKRVTYQDVLCV